MSSPLTAKLWPKFAPQSLCHRRRTSSGFSPTSRGGNDAQMRAVAPLAEILLDHAPPARAGWLDPDAEVAQARFEDDDVGRRDRHDDEDRPHRVGDNVARHQVAEGDAGRLGGEE